MIRVVVQKALYGAHITSRLGHLKISLGSTTALEHWGPRSNIRSVNTDLYTFLFLKAWASSASDGHRDIILPGSKDNIDQEQLAGLDWEKGAWMTHCHVFWLLGLDVVSDTLLETYTGSEFAVVIFLVTRFTKPPPRSEAR